MAARMRLSLPMISYIPVHVGRQLDEMIVEDSEIVYTCTFSAYDSILTRYKHCSH